ncbi:hypothetical protein ACFYXH_41210 [Streptomyces sp. NPDC002730]|uniref:hypothetical protein n=1 Tax=Streptomyces sp. NPDC002730 TaxID=3364662 RepID=UPI0036A04735
MTVRTRAWARVDASFVEQGQGRGVVVHVHLAPVSVDVGRGRGGSVDPVVLAATATGELTDSAGRRGGYIDDALAAGDEHWARWRPSPLAFSTTHLRCGQRRHQVRRRRYSARFASILSEPAC